MKDKTKGRGGKERERKKRREHGMKRKEGQTGGR